MLKLFSSANSPFCLPIHVTRGHQKVLCVYLLFQNIDTTIEHRKIGLIDTLTASTLKTRPRPLVWLEKAVIPPSIFYGKRKLKENPLPVGFSIYNSKFKGL